MKSLRSLFMLIALCLTAACSSTTTLSELDTVPANMTVPADELDELPAGATMGQLLTSCIDVIGKYNIQAARQDMLSLAITSIVQSE